MLRKLWNMLGRHTLCGAALLTAANLVQAQGSLPTIPQLPGLGGPTAPVAQTKGLGVPTPAAVALPTAPATPSSADDKARMERLEKQVQDLTNLLKSMQSRSLQAPISTETPQGGLTPKDVQQLINGYFAEKEMSSKTEAKTKTAEPYKVGTDLSMTASWQNGVVFETPNKDFWMRAGFRFQWDNVWFHQSATNRVPPGATAAGQSVPSGGIGTLLDGDYYRRVRPNFNGGFWEVGEFNVEIKMENVANGLNGMDDVWVGVKSIPFIGTVRLGHFHLPHGLEADMYSSSKPMTFFEVYSGNNAFFQGERCGSGIWLTNSFLNDRMTYAAVAYRPEATDNGADFANGDYGGIFRLTGLPIYENDGRCLLHLGGSGTYRHARTNPTTGAPGAVTFSTDAEMLDRSGGDDRFGNNLNPVPPGFKASPGNQTAWVSTGAILANAETVFGGELLYINGAFSVQAEYDWAFIDSANIGGKNRGNLGFTGGYIQAGYFLTGENRTYDKRLGRLGSEYITRANTPFWLVRDDRGNFNYGLGAWELSARFSRLDLNSGTVSAAGVPLVNGGILDQWEAGVNWHLNNNLRIQFLYLHADRYGFYGPPATTASGGWMNGFGIRTQLTF